jgi:hypothetical protein
VADEISGLSAADELKQRGAESLERALAFVGEHGERVAQRRAYVALRAGDPEALGDELDALQREDGGFADFEVGAAGWIGRELRAAAGCEALRGTLEALTLYADGELLHLPSVERAARFVEAAQNADGSFGAVGEDLEASRRIVATGFAAGLLARTVVARPETLADAGEFLATVWSPERVEDGNFDELAAFSLFYTNAHSELGDEALQWCGRELERGFRSRRYEALAVMQVLLICRVGSIPGASFASEELLLSLLDEQSADGGFDGLCADGREARVGPTIDAMRAIIGLCATF